MAITMMKRGADIDPQSLAQRQQMASELYKNSLAPQQPEQHWAQGLARVLQSGISGAQNAGIARDKEAYGAGRQQDMSKIAEALSSGNYQSILNDLNTPDAQMMALGLAKTEADRKNLLQTKENEYTRERKDKLTDMAEQFKQKKELAGLKGSGNQNPTRQIQSRLAGVEDEIEGLQNMGAQEQDPVRQQEIEARMQQLNANKENLISRINSSRGKVPKKELTPLNKALGEQQAKGITGEIESLRSEANTSSGLASKSKQILQLMAANPNVKAGLGREKLTAMQGVLNDLFPGSFPNVGDQQLFQKLLGQLIPAAIGQLKESGVGKVTQAEVLHIIPMITATNTNNNEGIQKIAGLTLTLDEPVQKAQLAMQAALKRSQTDPNFDMEDAVRRIKQGRRQDIEAAGLAYMNKDLGQKGQRAVLNPNYTEENPKIPKYISVPISEQ